MNPTDMTLLEKMNFTRWEIERRKHLFDLTENDVEILRIFADRVAENATTIVREFYEIQTKDPVITQIIGDSETMRRLRLSLREYVISLFQGPYDSEYVNRRLRIGQVHKRIGVSPELYMSGLRLLQSILEQWIERWGTADGGADSAAAAQASLHKAMLFDSQLVLDAYIDGFMREVDNIKREVAAFAGHQAFQPTAEHSNLEEAAAKDALTGLYNQRMFYEFMGHELAAAQRYRLPLSLAYMDLNGFKGVNDTHGHQAGDGVLVHVAEAMKATVRRVDVACRYGGDEFSLLLPRTDRGEATAVCRRLIGRFHERCPHDVSLSIGIVQTGPEEILAAAPLLRRADDLMYRAKKAHKSEGGDRLAVE